MTMKWISESAALPLVAQKVLLALPRQHGEFWDLCVAQLLIQHEAVRPAPIARGSTWPTEFYWRSEGRTMLVTGNAWWAMLNAIPLPPGAEHKTERGFHYIVQPTPIFVGQAR